MTFPIKCNTCAECTPYIPSNTTLLHACCTEMPLVLSNSGFHAPLPFVHETLNLGSNKRANAQKKSSPLIAQFKFKPARKNLITEIHTAELNACSPMRIIKMQCRTLAFNLIPG